MFFLSLNAHRVALFEINNTSWNNYLRIADNLVFLSIFVFMRNVLEFLSLISSLNLVFDHVSHALLAACTIFGVKILLILIIKYLLLLLKLFEITAWKWKSFVVGREEDRVANSQNHKCLERDFERVRRDKDLLPEGASPLLKH